jgi:hypothetical protein
LLLARRPAHLNDVSECGTGLWAGGDDAMQRIAVLGVAGLAAAIEPQRSAGDVAVY